jgi:hypothetical protein
MQISICYEEGTYAFQCEVVIKDHYRRLFATDINDVNSINLINVVQVKEEYGTLVRVIINLNWADSVLP